MYERPLCHGITRPYFVAQQKWRDERNTWNKEERNEMRPSSSLTLQERVQGRARPASLHLWKCLVAEFSRGSYDLCFRTSDKYSSFYSSIDPVLSSEIYEDR